MSTQQAEAFLARVQSDDDFAAKLGELREDPAAVQAFIAAEGIDATPEEIKDVVLESLGDELSEEQLASIAGGLSTVENAGIAIGATAVVVAAAVTAAAI
jgi:predicted ribosomally synthesized peptide with nif11-like leader